MSGEAPTAGPGGLQDTPEAGTSPGTPAPSGGVRAPGGPSLALLEDPASVLKEMQRPGGAPGPASGSLAGRIGAAKNFAKAKDVLHKNWKEREQVNPKKFFAIQQAGREADIYIFGDIVTERLSEEEVSAFSLKEAVRALNADTINVYIDSYGGSVSEGWAIYNELKCHPAKVRTYGTGFVASAALYPFMAGSERYAMDPSAYFFHQMPSVSVGNADDHRKSADEIEKLNKIGRAAFTDNTKLTARDVEALEKAEMWLSPYEALDMGIATAVLKNAPESIPAQSARETIVQRFVSGPESRCLVRNGSIQFRKPPEFTSVPKPGAATQPSRLMQTLFRVFCDPDQA